MAHFLIFFVLLFPSSLCKRNLFASNVLVPEAESIIESKRALYFDILQNTTTTSQDSDSDTTDSNNWDTIILNEINALLSNSYFYGGWIGQNKSDIFQFEEEKGFCSMYCESGSECEFTLHLYDGPFKNRASIFLAYNSDAIRKRSLAFNKTNSSLTYAKIDVSIIRNTELHFNPTSCSTDTHVYFINTSNNKPFIPTKSTEDKQFFGVQFGIHSAACGFNILTTILTSNDYLFDSQVLPYVLIMATFAVIEGGTCLFLHKQYKHKAIHAKKVSQGTLAIMNAFSFYLTFFHIFQFLNPVSYFILISIPFACLAFVIYPRLIWRVIVIQIKEINPRRKAKAIVQAYCWMLSIIVIPLLTVAIAEEIIYYVAMISLIPQISYNYQRGRKYRWNYWIIGCLIIPKLLFVNYLRGDPNNLFRYSPNIVLVSAFGGMFIMQCLVLLIQTRWPLFGYETKLPYEFIPTQEVKSKEDVCPICLEELKKSTMSDTLKQSLLEDIKKTRTMIKTPCDHKFHEGCLRKWLKAKSECPNCRQELPNLPEEDEFD